MCSEPEIRPIGDVAGWSYGCVPEHGGRPLVFVKLDPGQTLPPPSSPFVFWMQGPCLWDIVVVSCTGLLSHFRYEIRLHDTVKLVLVGVALLNNIFGLHSGWQSGVLCSYGWVIVRLHGVMT